MRKGDGWPYQESQSCSLTRASSLIIPFLLLIRTREESASFPPEVTNTNKQKQKNLSNYISQILPIIKLNFLLENKFQHIHIEVAQNEENMKVRDLTCNLITNGLEPLGLSLSVHK